MNITRTAAIAVFAALGFQSAQNWTNEKLASKLVKLPDTEGLDDIKDKAVKATIASVIDADVNEVINVVDAAEEPAPKAKKKKVVDEIPAEEPAPKAKKKKVVDEIPAEEPAPKAKKDIEVDAFGARVGSKASAVNACVIEAKGWVNEDEIVAKTGYTSDFVKVHLSFLLSQKKVEKQVLRQFRVPSASPAEEPAPKAKKK